MTVFSSQDNLWNVFRGGPAVMAIVNATPDSFYPDSRLASDPEAIVRRAEQAVGEGAAILDVGGYSSRPGAAEVSPDEELDRVMGAMEAIRAGFPHIPVSIDTFRSTIARGVMDRYGPCAINDISAGEADPAIIALAAERDVPYIAMHMRGVPATMSSLTDYEDVGREVENYFREKLRQLHKAGVRKAVLDPGFGFAKTLEQNYALLAALPRFVALGAPVLVGLSRKSMIYKVTGGGPEDALAGTAALHWEALRLGATMLRAHDVRPAVDVIKIYGYGR